MIHITIERSPYCMVCRGEKVKEIWTENTKRNERWFYHPLEGEFIGKVFCSQCGIIYHEDSI